MSDHPDLSFITDQEVTTLCFEYHNQDSINLPMGEITFHLLPDHQLSGTMTMLILLGIPQKGNLTIVTGEWSADKLNFTFSVAGYLQQAGHPKRFVRFNNLQMILEPGGQSGVLNGIAPFTVVNATSCS